VARGADPDPFRIHASDAGRLVVHRDFEDAVRALGFPDRDAVRAIFDSAAADGARGRQATAAVALPGSPRRLHLRPVRHGGLLAPLWGDRVVGLRRPIRELRTTETLLRRGAPVPRAVLVAGWRAEPLWTAVLGTLHVEDSLDGLAWLERGPDASHIVACAASAGRAVRAFHDAGGRHADLHIKNLLVCAGEPGSVLVIDLDRARAGEPPSPARRMRELSRLVRSLLKRRVFERIGRAGREAFFDSYTGGDAAFGRALLAHWPREKRRVARHARGYRSPG
jgi:3-deoxy-D-manno-octulosonic acid kinase